VFLKRMKNSKQNREVDPACAPSSGTWAPKPLRERAPNQFTPNGSAQSRQQRAKRETRGRTFYPQRCTPHDASIENANGGSQRRTQTAITIPARLSLIGSPERRQLNDTEPRS